MRPGHPKYTTKNLSELNSCMMSFWLLSRYRDEEDHKQMKNIQSWKSASEIYIFHTVDNSQDCSSGHQNTWTQVWQFYIFYHAWHTTSTNLPSKTPTSRRHYTTQNPSEHCYRYNLNQHVSITAKYPLPPSLPSHTQLPCSSQHKYLWGYIANQIRKERT